MSYLHQTTVLLNDAQTKALPTGSVTLQAAPGASLCILPALVALHANWVADYANIAAAALLEFRIGGSGVFLRLSEADGSQISALLAGGGPDGVNAFSPSIFRGSAAGYAATGFFGMSGFYDSDLVNQPLTLDMNNDAAGNFTGGNAGNSLRVSVAYYVLNITTGLFVTA